MAKEESKDLTFWRKRRQDHERAFRRIASGLDKQSALYKALGALAWGRYDYETSATSRDTITSHMRATAYLEGVWHALVMAGNETGGWDGRELSNLFWQYLHESDPAQQEGAPAS